MTQPQLPDSSPAPTLPQPPGPAAHDQQATPNQNPFTPASIDGPGQPIIDTAVGKKTLTRGASTVVFAATSPLLAGIGGVYLKDNNISPLDEEPRQLTADCNAGGGRVPRDRPGGRGTVLGVERAAARHVTVPPTLLARHIAAHSD